MTEWLKVPENEHQGTSTMLICPQCKFENPKDNKYCQNCGTSLIHKPCPQCNQEVILNTQYCDYCGAECGPIWRVIITQDTTENQSLPTREAEEQFNAASIAPFVQLEAGSYLDPERRYQLLAPLSIPADIHNNQWELRVLDCQPYQISPLKTLISQSVDASRIPRLAKAYIDIQSELQLGMPLIHDAWFSGDLQVVIIEDRSHWQPLLELWQKESTSSLQILHWCHQMTKLWTALEKVNCRQSLLELSNLRLDEDQTLILQQLYIEPSEITIRSLGQIWQTLFRQSQRTQFGSVILLLEDLDRGKIETIAELRSRLEEMAVELETAPTPSVSSQEQNHTSATTHLQLDDELEETTIGNDDLPTVVLSMQLSSLEDAGHTDVGRERHHNEDHFGIDTKLEKLEFPKSRVLKARGLYVLCDGMGGHASGEVASELAVTTLQKYFQEHWTSNQLPTEDCIRAGVYLANQVIYDLNQQKARSGVGRMGTTLVMLLVQNNQAAVAHVGDSRLYSLTRKRGLKQVTVDHEVGQREIARGVEASIAYSRPDAYQLTQALGPRNEYAINPAVEFFDINEDTLLLLASDGLSDNEFIELYWQTHLEPLLHSSANLDLGIINLIDLANQHNGHDNITAILVRVKVRPNQEIYQIE